MRVLLAGWRADDRETDAAEAWLSRHGFVARRAEAHAVDAPDVDWADAVWCHGAAPVSQPPSVALRARLAAGGGALLTLRGCQFLTWCGVESRPPLESRGTWRNADDPLRDGAFRDWPDFPHIRGLQGWATGVHPLFEGFQRGTFTRRYVEGEPFTDLGYDWPDWPAASQARVIGVERAYVRLHAGRAVAWEYAIGGRRLLCIGAHVALGGADTSLRAQRDRLLGNALGLAARWSPPGATEAFWPPRRAAVSPRAAAPLGLPRAPDAAVPDALSAGGDAGDAPFTLAGRAALVTGTERSGVQDVWLHPLGVVSGGLRLRLAGEEPQAVRVQVAPAEIRRSLRAGARAFTERIVPALHDPMTLVAFDDPAGHGDFEVRFSVPLRLEWPYDADALWPLAVACTSDDDEQHAIAITGADGTHAALILASGADFVSCTPVAGVPLVTVRGTRGANVRLLFAAGTEGSGDASLRARVGARVTASPDLDAERRRHFSLLQQRATRFITPEESLDAGTRWAMHRLDMFLARTPDGAMGLMAGYATSREGWNVSRPGYAWFFGRDACWCADAMLAIGMFDEAREVLRHLAATRDITGKVIHELTTSGVAHYDAADSTPLFLRLVARYWEWTNDLTTVRELWDAVRESVNFVTSTDRDGDALPENLGVGHGWIESGPLGGGAVTSYVASIWIDALRRLHPVAAALGDLRAAESLRALLDRASRSFEGRFRDPSSLRVALQLQPDGTRQMDLTALSAVPVALGVDGDASADDVLMELTAPEYAAPWGVRLIGRHDPRYNPRGYHYGAVWPLFTGWTALACFARGHATAGMRLARANASLWLQREKGAFDEVLDGDTGGAAGVCPDQAWSAAMAIAPLVYGAWGIQPNAPSRVLRVAPQLPEDWESAVLEGVRVGAASVDLHVRRERGDGRRIDHVVFLARDAAGALDRVIIEVLAAPDDDVVLAVRRGGFVSRTTRACRPGMTWLGVVVSVGDGEGHVTVERRAGP